MMYEVALNSGLALIFVCCLIWLYINAKTESREKAVKDKIRLHFYEKHETLIGHVEFLYSFGVYSVYRIDKWRIIINNKGDIVECPVCKEKGL